MNELAIFSGAGGGILGGHLLGWRTVCAVEIEPYPASVLLARQNDGILPPFPVWDDVCTFDGRPWRGLVDVVSGGFPCQDISLAGKGAGIIGERSGLWSEMARIIGEVRPRYVFVENSPALITRGLGTVLCDLASLGYDCRWTVLGAADVGAPHQRDRLWIVAYAVRRRQGYGETFNKPALDEERNASAYRQGWQAIPGETRGNGCYRSEMADSDKHTWHAWWNGDAGQRQGRRNADRGVECAHDVADSNRLHEQRQLASCSDQEGRQEQDKRQAGPCCDVDGWWESEPDVGRVANGVAARVVRLKAIGNGQVPAVAAAAWRLLTQ